MINHNVTQPSTIKCTWVPGTTDRVRVQRNRDVQELHVDHAVRMFGRDFLEAMYLKGRYQHDEPAVEWMPCR